MATVFIFHCFHHGLIIEICACLTNMETHPGEFPYLIPQMIFGIPTCRVVCQASAMDTVFTEHMHRWRVCVSIRTSC